METSVEHNTMFHRYLEQSPKCTLLSYKNLYSSEQIASLFWSIIMLMLWLYPYCKYISVHSQALIMGWISYCLGMRKLGEENLHHTFQPESSEFVHLKCLRVRICPYRVQEGIYVVQCFVHTGPRRLLSWPDLPSLRFAAQTCPQPRVSAMPQNWRLCRMLQLLLCWVWLHALCRALGIQRLFLSLG